MVKWEHKMDAEYQERFYNTFPGLYQKDKLLDRGFACGSGWYTLLWDLSEEILGLEDKYQVKVAVVQVKEKFGGLRYYFTVNMGEDGARSEEEKRFIFEEIRTAVHRAENRSYKTCDVCGKPGKLRVKTTGWYLTTCLEHAPEGSHLVEDEEDWEGTGGD